MDGATELTDLLDRCRREVDEGLLPSCQVAVAAGDELVAYETFGAAAADSRYVIFSCTKALVVGAFWLLLGEGAVSLDQRVADVIPEFGTNGKDVVTIRQLLLHESGFPHAPLDLVKDTSRQQRLERFARWRLNWEPGTRFEYHPTSAHWVMAELIERLSGIDYLTFIRQRVLDPLGLTRLRLGVPPDEQGDINDLVACGEPPTSEELEAVVRRPRPDPRGPPGRGDRGRAPRPSTGPTSAPSAFPAAVASRPRPTWPSTTRPCCTTPATCGTPPGWRPAPGRCTACCPTRSRTCRRTAPSAR